MRETWADIPLGTKGSGGKQDKRKKCKDKSFRKTKSIIQAAEKGELPDQIMFTFHPQPWTDKPFPWLKELVLQNVKNVVKYLLNNIRPL